VENRVKIRPLPEIDLARFAPLSIDEKRRQLEQHKAGRPLFSYDPLRRTIRDVINVTPDLFGPAEPTPWPKVEELIGRRAKPGGEYDSNIMVASSLYAYAVAEGVRAKQQEIRALPLSLDLKVAYWWPFVMVIAGRPLIPFFDPRRSHRLTSIGRQFVFSMMNEAIRVADPDLSGVQLGIFQFEPPVDDGVRPLRLHTDQGVPLFGFDELDEMIRETYAIWAEVLGDREAEARRRGSGARGSLI
jgi:hypothetical protein